MAREHSKDAEEQLVDADNPAWILTLINLSVVY
jgi:hypothetical protein